MFYTTKHQRSWGNRLRWKRLAWQCANASTDPQDTDPCQGWDKQDLLEARACMYWLAYKNVIPYPNEIAACAHELDLFSDMGDCGSCPADPLQCPLCIVNE